MRTHEKQQALLAGWLLIFCILGGLGLAGLRLRRETNRLERLRSQRHHLEELQNRVEAERGGLLLQAAQPVVTMEELSRVYLSSGVAAVRERAEALNGGGESFHVRRAEMDVDGVSWELLRRFLEIAESQTPPWRLQEVHLRAGLEGLEGMLVWEGLALDPGR